MFVILIRHSIGNISLEDWYWYYELHISLLQIETKTFTMGIFSVLRNCQCRSAFQWEIVFSESIQKMESKEEKENQEFCLGCQF